jgi:hypothetical protein
MPVATAACTPSVGRLYAEGGSKCERQSASATDSKISTFAPTLSAWARSLDRVSRAAATTKMGRNAGATPSSAWHCARTSPMA